MNSPRTIVGILVGGGPAPGINSVISAVTIRSVLGGCDVVGILDGFKWLMEGSVSQVRPLAIEEVSRIHFRGGSSLGTSRANPTKKAESLPRPVLLDEAGHHAPGDHRRRRYGLSRRSNWKNRRPGAFKSCMCRRPSTMTSIFLMAFRRSGFKPHGMSR